MNGAVHYGGETPDIIDNAFVIVDFAGGCRALLDRCMFDARRHGIAPVRSPLAYRYLRDGDGAGILCEQARQIFRASGTLPLRAHAW